MLFTLTDNELQPHKMDRFPTPDVATPTSDAYTFETISPRQIASPSPETSNEGGEEEQKPTKKRKSWGQQLPTPTTNLPPRKRAKTSAEKEQRAVERVIRNRKAAQTSRERKRLEVEKLEVSNRATEDRLASMQQQLLEVMAERDRLLRENQQLKGSRSGTPLPPTFKTETPNFTFDSLNLKCEPSPSPTLAPTLDLTNGQAQTNSTGTSDLAQYPAAILCDLPCHSEVPSETVSSSTLCQWTVLFHFLNNLFLLEAFTSSYTRLLSPLFQILNSIQQGTPLTLTTCQSSLTLMLWLLTTKTSTSRTTFRFQLLKRFLAINPNWARPLRAATERALSRSLIKSSITEGSRDGDRSEDVETWASLTSLLWAIDRIEREEGNLRREDPAGELRRTCASLGFEPLASSKNDGRMGSAWSDGFGRSGGLGEDHRRWLMDKGTYA